MNSQLLFVGVYYMDLGLFNFEVLIDLRGISELYGVDVSLYWQSGDIQYYINQSIISHFMYWHKVSWMVI